MLPFNLRPFFQVPVGCICHILLSCHHSPPAPEIPEHFLKPSSVLLHFLGLPPFRWPHPLCSTSERKPKKHCSSNSLSQTQPSVLHPPSSCSSVLHLELVSHSLSRSHTQYLKKMMYHLWIKQIIKRHLTLLPLMDFNYMRSQNIKDIIHPKIAFCHRLLILMLIKTCVTDLILKIEISNLNEKLMSVGSSVALNTKYLLSFRFGMIEDEQLMTELKKIVG